MSTQDPTGQDLIDLASTESPLEVRGTLADTIIGVAIVLSVLSTIAVSLRLFVRLYIQRDSRAWGWDDTLAVLSLVTYIPECVFAILASLYGLGTPDSQLDDGLAGRTALYAGDWQMFYAASSVLVKAGIAMTLLRLTAERKYRWPILAILVFTPVFTITIVSILVATCQPVGAQFNLALGSCPVHSAMAMLSYPFTAMTILLDWGCAFIPWLIIRDLQLNRRVKRGLSFVLGLGAFASIGAIARLPFLRYYTIKEDQLYHVANIVLWSIFENGVGLIAASLPPLNKLFKYYATSRDATPGSYPLGGGRSQTVGGNASVPTHNAFELSARRASAKLTTSAKGGQWDRLDDDSWTGRGINVRKTFEVVEETDSDAGLVSGPHASRA
ncbi:hypothetical protein N0V93_004067 [Gnomoniopsis smithogilvyi]|uniref:Rhodopsin domain-containing protein n=1 Tax=Gnomoniopsis smithogilvyi TaxID=1191159 RepID=A0A9W8YYB4_9PEZI|nr:hypothetical protein N0V93_004067 [Gnomoniopsis smithogilvyi]